MHDPLSPVSSLIRLEALLRAAQKGVYFMSLLLILMAACWIATLAIIACIAFSESGKRLELGQRLARRKLRLLRKSPNPALICNPPTRMRPAADVPDQGKFGDYPGGGQDEEFSNYPITKLPYYPMPF